MVALAAAGGGVEVSRNGVGVLVVGPEVDEDTGIVAGFDSPPF